MARPMMRQWITLVENTAIRDKAFDRFWWKDGEFEDVNDTTHADWVVSYYSDMGGDEYDDPIYELGETEEEVNAYYMESGAVRGGVMKGPQGAVAYLDGKNARTVHLCLKDLLEQHPDLVEVAVDAGQHHVNLQGARLEFFIRRGRIPPENLRESEDYSAYDIPADAAGKFADLGIRADDAAFMIRLFKGVDNAFAQIERERIQRVLDRAGTRAQDVMAKALPALRDSDRPISYRTACALIATDDRLWSFIDAWLWNAEEAVDNRPEDAARFLAVLKRIHPPIHKKLYRGQRRFGDHDSHSHGFHSWSANRDTAETFAERDGRIIEIDRPIQGVALSDLMTWRMRLFPGESHYSGPQAEWFVVDQPEQFTR